MRSNNQLILVRLSCRLMASVAFVTVEYKKKVVKDDDTPDISVPYINFIRCYKEATPDRKTVFDTRE